MTYSIDFRRKVLSVREKERLTIAEVAVFGFNHKIRETSSHMANK